MCGIVLHFMFPLAQNITQIPETAYYTVDVAFYVAIVSIIFTFIENKVKTHQNKVDVFYYNTGKNALLSECSLNLNETKYDRLSIQIVVSGSFSNTSKMFLEIRFPTFVTVQSKKKLFVGELRNNVLTLKLSDLAEQNVETNFNTTLDFTLLQSSEYNGQLDSPVVGHLYKNSFMTVLNNKNRLKIHTISGGNIDGISN